MNGLEESTKTFFQQSRLSIIAESGEALVGCESAHLLLKSVDEPSDSQVTLTSSLAAARNAFTQFESKLKGAETAAQTAAQIVREQMTKDGLPTGGKDRETKKQAFQQSEIALERYRLVVQEIEQLLDDRKAVHDELIAKCKERTEVRKETAQNLTATLAHDLDQAILQIVVDAQPVADMNEYKVWLQQFLEPGFARYRQNRTDALLKRAIAPASLREFLLDPSCASKAILIDEARQEDGRISEDDAKTVREKCCARIRVPLDWIGGDLPETVRATLPPDLASGVWVFPDDKNKLRIDGVLQLDEVVLDDLPVIKLNDRPTDSASTLRPVHELSPGQRCSAILPILLLSGDAPVIIDQPEENLDNRLIRQVIVNILSSMKLKRQVIIATHNPNLPVLGDCEQAIILQAVGQRESQIVATGDLEARDVTSYVTEIMEGGREAFQYRHSVYQNHWKGPVADGPR